MSEEVIETPREFNAHFIEADRNCIIEVQDTEEQHFEVPEHQRDIIQNLEELVEHKDEQEEGDIRSQTGQIKQVETPKALRQNRIHKQLYLQSEEVPVQSDRPPVILPHIVTNKMMRR